MAQKHHRMSLKWLRPFFNLPARPAKSLFFVKISKWPKLVNFHPIWFKLGMEVIYNPLNGKLTFEVAAAIFFYLPAQPTKIEKLAKIFNFCVFHLIWMKFDIGAEESSEY